MVGICRAALLGTVEHLERARARPRACGHRRRCARLRAPCDPCRRLLPSMPSASAALTWTLTAGLANASTRISVASSNTSISSPIRRAASICRSRGPRTSARSSAPCARLTTRGARRRRPSPRHRRARATRSSPTSITAASPSLSIACAAASRTRGESSRSSTPSERAAPAAAAPSTPSAVAAFARTGSRPSIRCWIRSADADLLDLGLRLVELGRREHALLEAFDRDAPRPTGALRARACRARGARHRACASRRRCARRAARPCPGPTRSAPSMPSASAALTCTLTAGPPNASTSSAAAPGSLPISSPTRRPPSSLPVSRPATSASRALSPSDSSVSAAASATSSSLSPSAPTRIGRRADRALAELAERLRHVAPHGRGCRASEAHRLRRAPRLRSLRGERARRVDAHVIAAVLQREDHLIDVDHVGVLAQLRRATACAPRSRGCSSAAHRRRRPSRARRSRASPASPRCACRAPDRSARSRRGTRAPAVGSVLPNRPRPRDRVDPDPAALVRGRLDEERDALRAELAGRLDDALQFARSSGTSSARISSSSAVPIHAGERADRRLE